MTEIFDLSKLNERSFHARKMIAIHAHMDFKEVIHIVKHDMARNIAAMILEKKDFFWEKGDTLIGVATLEYGVDCVVITRAELADIQRQSFKQGVEHSYGYMSSRVL